MQVARAVPKRRVTPNRSTSRATVTPARPKVARSRAASSVHVLTYNTAGDGCKHTPESEIPLSQPFQAVIKGEPDAPIIACQETTKPLLDKLSELSKNGNFKVVSYGPSWVPAPLRYSDVLQDNMVVVPKRYQIQSVRWKTYGGRLGTVFHALSGFLFHGQPFSDVEGAAIAAGYCDLRLKDTVTGKSFTVIATHLTGQDAVRRVQEPQLISAVKKAEAQGPTVVMGDFNTPSEATNFRRDPDITRFWKAMDAVHVIDLHPTDATSGRKDIDHVLVSGFSDVSDEVYDGGKLTIPGRPDASEVSDHYAHGDELRFE